MKKVHVEYPNGGSERGGVVHGSRELKLKIHGSRELKQTFHESRTIQRLIFTDHGK